MYFRALSVAINCSIVVLETGDPNLLNSRHKYSLAFVARYKRPQMTLLYNAASPTLSGSSLMLMFMSRFVGPSTDFELW